MRGNSDAFRAILEIKNLSVVYNHRTLGRVYALSNVSMDVRPGEALGIAGESGSGKSTLLKSILRLFNPGETAAVSGEILYLGRDVMKMDKDALLALRRGGIYMIFQHPYSAFNPVIKIGRQLDETIRLHGSRREAPELLEACGLDGRIPDLFPHNLSGGQLQRLQFAMALASGARILLADEPTTSLDAVSQFEIIELIKTLLEKESLTLLFVSHDLSLIRYLTDRAVIFYGGTLIEDSPCPDLFKHPLHPYTDALIRCIPQPDREPGIIPGDPPDLSNPPAGCPFFPRCSRACDICLGPVPLMRTSHKVRCFNAGPFTEF
ncbi:MAG: ABC transporter ATP-binding protein [Candidatus Omnitrophota bacterium]|nr:ABC transporter ATP-binding protein [Candidatus Omnitrophota bacterium]MBU2528047.1 ABC transporter ATP-binding protein [bacterium]MBU3929734.1 ABC transporter ATP-binding protein [bacterium]MBU4123563.1 ABC transporter ATP-binding protein [bacterium]